MASKVQVINTVDTNNYLPEIERKPSQKSTYVKQTPR